eukprot:gene10208-11890_t
MGYAHGELLKDDIVVLMAQFDGYIDQAIEQYVQEYSKYIPAVLLDIIDKYGAKAALDYELLVTKKYTRQSFFDELQGISDASGVSYRDLLRMHMFPELIKASCSILGAWGEATIDGGLYQLRALDWGIDNPLRRFPLLYIYHPLPGQGHDYSMLSWTCFIGALTGYSQHMSISEKVWLDYNGTYSREGVPWYLLLKDILQYDSSVDEALNRIYNSERTCAIYLGISSNTTNTTTVIEYSNPSIHIFDDTTPFPGYQPSPPQHPLIKNVVYVDKHRQPSSDPCMASLIESQHGSINVDTMINLVSLFQTGDLHIAIYDFSHNKIYVSVATTTGPYPSPSSYTLSPSYDNQFIASDYEVAMVCPGSPLVQKYINKFSKILKNRTSESLDVCR